MSIVHIANLLMPSAEILHSINHLHQRCESIAAVMGTDSEPNRFTRAITALEKLSQEHQIPMAIVGGLGAIYYGYAAATDDIDLAIGDSDLERLVELAPVHGFKISWNAKSGWHTLMHGDVEVNIVPEGRKARDTSPTTIPGPIDLGVKQGLGYSSLSGWVELKISSARQKDFGHIVEVLKKIDHEQTDQISKHLGQVHQDYQNLFLQLVKQAAAEKQQERRRE